MSRRPPSSDTEATARKLCVAAMAEFNEPGFVGTDTNRIARRAGFAPQTFYRWYADKTQIFIAAYRAWEDAEKDVLQCLLEDNAPVGALVGLESIIIGITCDSVAACANWLSKIPRSAAPARKAACDKSKR